MVIAPTTGIRSHFPALGRVHNGRQVAYFDGPGGTQVPGAVGDAMLDYLYHHNANSHWAYPSSQETDRMVSESRVALADFVNGEPDEVVFGQNMTSLTFHLARGLGRKWGHGDEIVVTELDHHANRAPWEALAVDRGVTIRVVPFLLETCELDWEALDDAIGPKTRLVAVGAASNALGTVNDVARVSRLARARGALSFVDAVHSAPHVLVDVQAIGCDLLACSPYKFYGPHQGVLWGRAEVLALVDIPKLAPAPSTAPEKFETGTQSHEGLVGSAAAVDFLASLAPSAAGRREALAAVFGELHHRGQSLFRRLWDGLGAIRGVTRYGPGLDRPRTTTLAFTVAGRTAEAVALHLAARGLFLSHGDFYAASVVEKLGVEALVRAGIACYTSEGEVDRLIEGVAELQ